MKKSPYVAPEINLDNIDLSLSDKNRYLYVLQVIYLDPTKKHNCTQDEIITVGILKSLAMQRPEKFTQKFPEFLKLVQAYSAKKSIKDYQADTNDQVTNVLKISDDRRLGIFATTILFPNSTKGLFQELESWIDSTNLNHESVTFDLPPELVFIDNISWKRHLKSTRILFSNLTSERQLSLILIRIKLLLNEQIISLDPNNAENYPQLYELLNKLEMKKVAISK